VLKISLSPNKLRDKAVFFPSQAHPIRDAKLNKKIYFSVSALKNEADKLASKYSNTIPMVLDIERSQEELEKLIKIPNLYYDEEFKELGEL
jgi:hypothetical protein